MALVFDYRNIKIDCFSNEIPEDNFNKQLIIYPVLSYKIYAPVLDDMNLNLFQKSVLSILNKGRYEVQEVSSWLKLHPLLVKTILAELNNKGLFDGGKNTITKKGKELIEGTYSWFASAESLRKDIRYIYQDIYTHKLYPVLIDIEKDNKNIYFEDNKFCVGSIGKKDSFDYKLIEPNNHDLKNPPKPDNQDVFKAINKHAKQFVPNSRDDIKNVPNAIQFLDEEPTLSYIATWIYIDKNISYSDEFEVLDPFNVYEETFWLKDSIMKAAKNNKAIVNVLDSLTIDAKAKEKEKLTENMKVFHTEVEEEINKKFDFTLQEFSELRSALSEFYYDIKFYDIHKSAIYLKNTFRKAQIVLETLFKTIFEKSPSGYKQVKFVYNKAGRGMRDIPVKDVESKIRNINKDCIIPKWYYNFGAREMGKALTNPNKTSLRTLYVAAAVASYYDRKNPVFQLLQKKDDLLIFLEKVAEGRNAVGHKYLEISDDEIDKYYDDVKEVENGINEIIIIFLNEVNNG